MNILKGADGSFSNIRVFLISRRNVRGLSQIYNFKYVKKEIQFQKEIRCPNVN